MGTENGNGFGNGWGFYIQFGDGDASSYIGDGWGSPTDTAGDGQQGVNGNGYFINPQDAGHGVLDF